MGTKTINFYNQAGSILVPMEAPYLTLPSMDNASMTISTDEEPIVTGAGPTKAPSTGWVAKLKTRWGLTTNVQVALVLLTFACTGSTVAFLRRTIFEVLGIGEETHWALKTVIYLVVVFPLYQVLILVYGAIFGQFAFFWNYEKKMISRFRRKPKS